MRNSLLTPAKLEENRPIRLLGRVAIAVCFVNFVPLVLANAGVTKYKVLISVVCVSLLGLVAGIALIDKAGSLDRRGMDATASVKNAGLALIVGLLGAFAAIWMFQIHGK